MLLEAFVCFELTIYILKIVTIYNFGDYWGSFAFTLILIYENLSRSAFWGSKIPITMSSGLF